MRIKDALIASFKSPFFNLLAVTNLCAIAFAGPNPLFISLPAFRLIAAANLPALVASWILVPQPLHKFAFVPPLIYLQWILIGAFAKLIASRVELKPYQMIFNFHAPRLNISAAATASAENASVIAQNTPCGPKP